MTDTARFAIPMPEDGDAPNLPAQLQTAAERIEVLLGRAGGQIKRNYVAGYQTRSNAAFGLLGTPDRVDDIVIPNNNDILCIAYRALWNDEVDSGAASAAIFLESTQLKVMTADVAAPQVQAASTRAGASGGSVLTPLVTTPFGLVSFWVAEGITSIGSGVALGSIGSKVDGSTYAEVLIGASDSVYIGGDLTGNGAHAFGGVCMVPMNAGTYDVSVQFKNSAGNVGAKERLLTAWTMEAA